MARELKAILTISLPETKALAVSANGKWLAAADEKFDTVHVLDAENGKPIAKLGGHEIVDGVYFSPDGSTLIPTDFEGELRIYDTKTWKIRHTLGKKGTAVAFARDSKTVAVGMKKTVSIFNVASGRELLKIDPAGKVRVDKIVYSPDGKTIAVGPGKLTNLWDVGSGRPAGSFTNKGDVMRILFSPDGKTLATCGSPGRATLWDRASGKSIVLNHGATVCDVAFCANAKQVITAGADAQAKLWNAADGSPMRSLTASTPDDWIYFVAMSPTAKHAITSSAAGSAILWDATTWEQLATMPGRPSSNCPSSPRWYPDGKRFAMAMTDAVRVYEL